MTYPQFHYRWVWDLRSSPEALWPFAADTNRFDRDTGLPPAKNRSALEPELTNGRYRLRLFRFGIAVEWYEEPFEWIYPYRFGVLRRYISGPVAELHTFTELEQLACGGTRLVYQVWAKPRNPF